MDQKHTSILKHAVANTNPTIITNELKWNRCKKCDDAIRTKYLSQHTCFVEAKDHNNGIARSQLPMAPMENVLKGKDLERVKSAQNSLMVIDGEEDGLGVNFANRVVVVDLKERIVLGLQRDVQMKAANIDDCKEVLHPGDAPECRYMMAQMNKCGQLMIVVGSIYSTLT